MLNACLPPVRRPVPLGPRRTHARALELAFAGFGVQPCGSGTEALALAIMDARRRSSATVPEVVLPAYGCPDLVSASLCARVHPRLVDIRSDRWGYDLDSLARAISPNTVAIVAVNLLGAGDQAAELRAVADRAGVFLIQDSAQHLPTSLPVAWSGDYVVLSFGRGKPLNLLRGGALLHPKDSTAALESLLTGVQGGIREWLVSRRLAGLAFNLATHSHVYAASRALMGSAVGGTRYVPLEHVEAASNELIAQLGSALQGYSKQPGYDATIWSEACAVWASRGVHPVSCDSGPLHDAGALRLRLPLLALDEATRDAVVAALDRAGLGATAMYGASLDKLGNVPDVVASQGPFPVAADFARRLFTLPTHSQVTASAVGCARGIVEKLLDSPEALDVMDARARHSSGTRASRSGMA